jgi:hypothetical protein
MTRHPLGICAKPAIGDVRRGGESTTGPVLLLPRHSSLDLAFSGWAGLGCAVLCCAVRLCRLGWPRLNNKTCVRNGKVV